MQKALPWVLMFLTVIAMLVFLTIRPEKPRVKVITKPTTEKPQEKRILVYPMSNAAYRIRDCVWGYPIYVEEMPKSPGVYDLQIKGFFIVRPCDDDKGLCAYNEEHDWYDKLKSAADKEE
jgi:hypothetical protein